MAKRILIVDDTQFMRKMLADYLVQSGYEVAGEAGNGREAIRLYEQLRPDLVIMDINMPEMGGIEAIREVLKLDSGAVVLVCTAASQQEHIHEAMREGAKGYILKPFKMTRVLEVIGKYAGSKEEPMKPQSQSEVAGDGDEAAGDGDKAAGDGDKAAVETIEAAGDGDKAAVEAIEAADGGKRDAKADAIGASNGKSEAKADAIRAPDGGKRDESARVDAVEGARAKGEQNEPAEMAAEGTGQGTEAAASMLPAEEQIGSSTSATGQENTSAANREEPPAREDAPAKRERAGIVAPFRRRDSVHSFVSSMMCHWQEERDGEMASFTVVCTESENKVLVEMTGAGREKQTMQFTLDGLLQLSGWLEDHVERTSGARGLG